MLCCDLSTICPCCSLSICRRAGQRWEFVVVVKGGQDGNCEVEVLHRQKVRWLVTQFRVKARCSVAWAADGIGSGSCLLWVV